MFMGREDSSRVPLKRERRERKQAGPSSSLGPVLWHPLPWGKCQSGARNVGDPVPTPCEERLSSPHPQTTGWEGCEERSEVLSPLLWPQRASNPCPAGPHLTSLSGQGMGGVRGLVCLRTGRE